MTPNRRTFLKQLRFGAAGLGLVSWAPGCQTARTGADHGQLRRSLPEAEGVASSGILAFIAAAARNNHEMHSLMMVRHGRVIAEGWWAPYGPQFEMLWRYYETPHHDAVTCGFEGDQVQVAFLNSMAKMSPAPKDKRPVLQGQMG